MDILEQYLDGADEIAGNRTPDEVKYDKEVIRWLRKGKLIKKAISKANEKFPSEALDVTDDMVGDVEAHYEYLAEHESIVQKMNQLK